MFALKTSFATSTISLSATPVQIVGSNPGRWALILPTPAAGNTIWLSPASAMTASALFAVTQYTGLHILFYERIGEALQLPWWAKANASFTAEITEVQADSHELAEYCERLRRATYART